MRISDWSSDVCSSDLLVQRAVRGVAKQPGDPAGRAKAPMCIEAIAGGDQARYVLEAASGTIEGQARGEGFARVDPEIAVHMLAGRPRSEEHTSEIQSLMRNSYAVFCLKTKLITNNYSELCVHKM